MKIKKSDLINTYAQSIGIETAKELIADKINAAALKDKENYSREEAVRICGELEKEGGLIRIVAQSFLIQLEHKRSEEQTLLLDNIDTQIWYLTDIETYGAVNKAHAEFLGIEKAGLEDRNLYEIISEEEAGRFVAGNKEVFDKKIQIQTEEIVKSGKGETRLLSITRTPKLNHNGNVEYVICAAQDITERKQAEKQIKHLNSVLKAIRNVNQLIMVEKDSGSLLQKACDALIKTRGYIAAWLGFLRDDETFATVVGSGFGEDVSRFCQHVMNGDYPPCIKKVLAQKDPLVVLVKSKEYGDCFFKDVCIGKDAVIIRVEHAGRFLGILAVLLAPDVTVDDEEKGLLQEVASDIGIALFNIELEETLRETRDYLKNLIDHANAPIIVWDREERITLFNHAFERLTGYAADEVIGKEVRMLFPEEKRDKSLSRIASALAGEYWESVEIPILRKDGNIRIVLWNLSNIYAEDGKTLLATIAQGIDITDRLRMAEEKKKLEAQLQQAQKMEAIGILAGGIAHDFNNILGAIMGYTELAQFDAGDNPSLKTRLDEILHAGNRAKDLVQQILTFSRQSEQEFKPIQSNLIVKEALKLLRASLPTTIKIHQDIQGDAMVMGDPVQIHQVLMNLCTNAAHAMRDKGGLLDVSLVNVELDSNFVGRHPGMKAGPYLQLTVSDTGHGMPADVLARIFEPFFTTKEKGEGTGLGLSVVHGIVKSYGGTIYAYSEQGKGSSFKVYLPAIEGRLEPRKREEKALPKGIEHILFVDDEQMLVDVWKQLLESLGYKVTTRTSSTEALEFFRSSPERFDIVITDQTMPNMTGDKLAKELMAVRSDIPVILCSGFSTRITQESIYEMGIRAFVMKPLLLRDLAETIRKVLDE